TPSAFQPNFRGSGAQLFGDGFVAKFSAAGALVYLTYLGGSGDDAASAIAVDSAGDAYVCGLTTSSNFPTTANAYQTVYGGAGNAAAGYSGDAFVAKLNPSGNTLIYSTYLGGNDNDAAAAIAIDASGNAYVAGATASRNFPATPGAYQTTMNGAGGEPVMPIYGTPVWDPGDAFVAKFDPTGSKLLECTMLGGGSDDAALAIALDPSGNIYIGGFTISGNFPVTAGAFDTVFGGTDPQDYWFNMGDGFVAKFNPTLTKLMYSTYFGGAGDDSVSAIAVDSAGEVYMTGSTSSGSSGTFPLKTSAGVFQPKYGGYLVLPPDFSVEQLFGDAYVAKLNAAGSALVYLSYLGGSNNDAGTAIAIDNAGNAYVTGFTDSPNFPLAGAPFQSTFGGDGGSVSIQSELFGDAFLAVVNPTATALIYSTYLGGKADDLGNGIAIDGKGNVYVAGNTVSTNFPVTTKAFQPAYAGGGPLYGGMGRGDAFYSVFAGVNTGPAGPVISSVSNNASGTATIAPNTWVSIYGTGLAPDSRLWQGSDFVNGQMPTGLDGVSVTMNGTPAYVEYINATQINVLTPLSLTAGPVQVVVTNGTTASAAFPATAQAVAPAFFVFGGGPYVAAVHVAGSFPYIGPTNLYPGYSSPAAPGETIELYANGFGAITPAVTAGSAAQVGNLPTLPVVTIGGIQATVTYAGINGAPGEFQFNVVIPPSLPAGDAAISASYNGVTTQSGTLITIQ
ncbi:MAG: SBBP repeat-containing protein, partial [Bryobacteraceae bacterium]